MSALQSAASSLAAARVNAERAQREVAIASAAVDEITRRRAALEGDRAKILAARRAGTDDPDAGARLLLIAADLDTLDEIATERAGPLAQARAVAQEAGQVLARSQQIMGAAADEDLCARLVEHATALDALFRRTINKLAAVTQRIGGRPRWAPTAELANDLQRLHLGAALLRR